MQFYLIFIDDLFFYLTQNKKKMYMFFLKKTNISYKETLMFFYCHVNLLNKK